MEDYDKEERQKLDYFGDKYAKKEYEYFQETRELLSDINYLEETFKRTRLNKNYGVEIIPVQHGWLLKSIITHHSPSYWKNEDNLARFLRITAIVRGIASKLLEKDNNTVNEEAFKDFVDFGQVYTYWTNGVEYRDTVLGQIYYGCQTNTTELKEKYDKAIEEKES